MIVPSEPMARTEYFYDGWIHIAADKSLCKVIHGVVLDEVRGKPYMSVWEEGKPSAIGTAFNRRTTEIHKLRCKELHKWLLDGPFCKSGWVP